MESKVNEILSDESRKAIRASKIIDLFSRVIFFLGLGGFLVFAGALEACKGFGCLIFLLIPVAGFWGALIVPFPLIPIISIRLMRNIMLLRTRQTAGRDSELESRTTALKADLVLIVLIFLGASYLNTITYRDLDAPPPSEVLYFGSQDFEDGQLRTFE